MFVTGSGFKSSTAIVSTTMLLFHVTVIVVPVGVSPVMALEVGSTREGIIIHSLTNILREPDEIEHSQ